MPWKYVLLLYIRAKRTHTARWCGNCQMYSVRDGKIPNSKNYMVFALQHSSVHCLCFIVTNYLPTT